MAKAPSRKAQLAAANELRGEATLTLEGTDYVMRPSYSAIVQFERATGKSLFELSDDARNGKLSLEDASIIACETIRAQGHAVNDRMMTAFTVQRVGELIMGGDTGGLVGASGQIAVMLLLASSGGYTGTGELKAAADSTQTATTGQTQGTFAAA
jgi:hypothetical protein